MYLAIILPSVFISVLCVKAGIHSHLSRHHPRESRIGEITCSASSRFLHHPQGQSLAQSGGRRAPENKLPREARTRATRRASPRRPFYYFCVRCCYRRRRCATPSGALLKAPETADSREPAGTGVARSQKAISSEGERLVISGRLGCLLEPRS